MLVRFPSLAVVVMQQPQQLPQQQRPTQVLAQPTAVPAGTGGGTEGSGGNNRPASASASAIAVAVADKRPFVPTTVGSGGINVSTVWLYAKHRQYQHTYHIISYHTAKLNRITSQCETKISYPGSLTNTRLILYS